MSLPDRTRLVNPPSSPAHTPHRRGKAIEVIACRPGDGSGTLKATCSVRCGGVTIHGIRVHSGKRGTFVDMPSRLVEGRWQAIVEITSQALLEAIRQVVIAAAAGVTR